MEQADWILSAENLSVKTANEYQLDHVNLEMRSPENWAITGESGSGKTLLAKCIAGLAFHHGDIRMSEHLKREILFVSQEHRFTNRSHTTDFYYQQRYNSQDAEDSLTVAEYLGHAESTSSHPAMQLLNLEGMLDKNLIQLSNGENKRLQLALALQQHPSLLIADNPYTGLDSSTRQLLDQLFAALPAAGTALILITAAEHLPAFISHIAVLEQGKLVYAGTKESYHSATPVSRDRPAIHFAKQSLPAQHSFRTIVDMKNISVKYGDKVILQQINWQVNAGECWALSGPNGSGKSTLLSLITGDNPQAYSNDIWLFDKKRGSGESIWDIKKNIGFVSPELHLYFDSSFNVYEVIASGLFDTIGLFRQLSEEQHQQVKHIIQLMGLEDIQLKYLHQLSRGAQRLALLARALVKMPPLLVLDEPCQGLDEKQSMYIRQIINELCQQPGTTLIYVSHYIEDYPSCIQYRLHLTEGKATRMAI